MRPMHPGRILKEELAERGVSPSGLARALRVPADRMLKIVQEERAISADTAARLGRYFGNSARFWITLQTNYDLAVLERDHGAALDADVQPAPAA